MRHSAPFRSSTMQIEPQWIDYNGHLNMAYYTVLFERGHEEFSAELGLGPDYAKARKLTTYTAEIHLCYVRELHRGDQVEVTLQLLDHDEKRLHTYQELRHADGWLSATCETLTLHVDMAGPKVAPFPADIAERLEAAGAAHAQLPRPERAGRHIAIRRKR